MQFGRIPNPADNEPRAIKAAYSALDAIIPFRPSTHREDEPSVLGAALLRVGSRALEYACKRRARRACEGVRVARCQQTLDCGGELHGGHGDGRIGEVGSSRFPAFSSTHSAYSQDRMGVRVQAHLSLSTPGWRAPASREYAPARGTS